MHSLFTVMSPDFADQLLLLFGGIVGVLFMALSITMYWRMDGRSPEEIRYRIRRLIPLGIFFMLLWIFSIFR